MTGHARCYVSQTGPWKVPTDRFSNKIMSEQIDAHLNGFRNNRTCCIWRKENKKNYTVTSALPMGSGVVGPYFVESKRELTGVNGLRYWKEGWSSSYDPNCKYVKLKIFNSNKTALHVTCH